MPIACRLAGAEDLALFARALSAPETAWVSEAASIGSGWSKRLLSLSLRLEDGSAALSVDDAGEIEEFEAARLISDVQAALEVCGPVRGAIDRNAWHVALCAGAKHSANWTAAYALGGCNDLSFSGGKYVHVTDHPEWWYGVPQREMLDCHWMAYRAAVAVRIEADKQG